jgi:hypothetical protein
MVKGEDRGGVSWDTLRVIFLNFAGIKTADREKTPENDDEH